MLTEKDMAAEEMRMRGWCSNKYTANHSDYGKRNRRKENESEKTESSKGN